MLIDKINQVDQVPVDKGTACLRKITLWNSFPRIKRPTDQKNVQIEKHLSLEYL